MLSSARQLGGSTHAGVGICVGRKLAPDIADASFHCYSERVCALHFSMGHVKYRVFACYFPTTWAPDSEVEGLYDLLGLLITNCEQAGANSIIGGDFNANIGTPLPGDDFTVFGRSGTGNRNDRGAMLMQWTVQNKLFIQSRLDNRLAQDEAWTCCRAMDLSLVQLDYILSSPKLSVENSWCDFSIPIGLDHRCVHCRLKLLLTKPKKRENILSFKNWRPNLDENNVASDFQSKIRSLLAANCTTNMEILENMLVFFLFLTPFGSSWHSPWHSGKTQDALQPVSRIEDIEAFSEALSNTKRPQNPEFANSEVASP